MLRPDRLGADVEQQEVAGAVGVLGLAGGKADLAHRRGLLVAEVAGQQHRPAERPVRAGQPVAGRICGRPDSRQHLARYAEQRQQLVIPVQGGQVHQHGAAGVSRVSDVHAAVGPAGQVPQQPAVDGAEQRVARLGGRPGAVDVLQDPLQLAAGEVGGRRQPGPLPDQLAAPVPVQRGGDRVGAGVLPDDRVAVGLAGPPVPHHRGLALVGDADRGQVTGPQPGPAQAGFDDLAGARPDLRRIMLHPARPGHDLVVLQLVAGHLAAVMVEDHETGAGRALVDGGDELGHAGLHPGAVGDDASGSARARRRQRGAAPRPAAGDRAGTTRRGLSPVSVSSRRSAARSPRRRSACGPPARAPARGPACSRPPAPRRPAG